MTPEQEIFLELAVIKQKKYAEISKELNVDRKTLSEWEVQLKPLMKNLSNLRKIWIKKFKTTDFNKFKIWYESTQKKCYYCKITEQDIELLLRHNLIKTKRIKTRGKKLEIERLEPNEKYDNLDNLVLCCYWCNNAKTDEFSKEEFINIGQLIGNNWNNRLRKARELEQRFQERFGGEIGITVIKNGD